VTSGGNNCNHFVENQLTKFSAKDAGDFNDAAGEREMATKCGRDAGDLVGLVTLDVISQTHKSDLMFSESASVPNFIINF